MKIGFRLFWSSKNTDWKRAFKSKDSLNLFSEYIRRISYFVSCDAQCISEISQYEKRSRSAAFWLCEKNPRKAIESEEIAVHLERMTLSGISELHIGIGGPDGLSSKEFQTVKPGLIWSFGPLTLPHELAAIIAAEQIYRAWTILKKHPYHSGH